MLVLVGPVVYTVVDVCSTVLVGASVDEGETDVVFVVSTVVTASVVEVDSVTTVGQIYRTFAKMSDPRLQIEIHKLVVYKHLV